MGKYNAGVLIGNWFEERIAQQEKPCACARENGPNLNAECNLCRIGERLRFRMPTFDWQAVMWDLREAKQMREQRCYRSSMKIIMNMCCWMTISNKTSVCLWRKDNGRVYIGVLLIVQIFAELWRVVHDGTALANGLLDYTMNVCVCVCVNDKHSASRNNSIV